MARPKHPLGDFMEGLHAKMQQRAVALEEVGFHSEGVQLRRLLDWIEDMAEE